MRFIASMVILVAVAAACSAPEDTPAGSPGGSEVPATGCVEVFQSASAEGDADETFAASLSEAGDRLDSTIPNCRSVDEWAREAERVGIKLDLDPAEFLRTRCQEGEDLHAAPICEEVG